MSSARHHRLAYVPADVSLWPSLTGGECLDLLAGVGPGTDAAYQDELLERFALDPGQRARAYSTGNRQNVALVAAFATRAPLLVLDEPTSGLDPLMEREFRACLAEAAARGQTVFLSSHRLAEVEAVCSRVGILRAGRLVEVAGLDDLRRLHRAEVVVDLAIPTPALQRLAELPGVTELRWPTPVRLELSLTGPPGPVFAGTGRRRRRAPPGTGAHAGGDLPRLLRRGHGVTSRTAPDRVPAAATASARSRSARRR
jgi:ABC-2 type transport system ATP-binding protein